MEEMIARDNILKKIQAALCRKTSMPFPDQSDAADVFKRGSESLAAQFEKEFTRLLGKFYAVTDEQMMVRQIIQLAKDNHWRQGCLSQSLLSRFPGLHALPFINTGPPLEADVAFTDCECLLARTGTIVISSAQPSGRAIPVYAPAHVIFAQYRQLMPDIRESIAFLKNKYPDGMPSMLSFSSGPSRTGDIEKTLVVGVHGPREVILFLLPDSSQHNPSS